MTDRPLDGITVVSLEQAVAAPFATRQLADLGARVIKVERNTGDFAREYDTQVHGMASYFVWLNRSKESVVLDLKSAHGLAALRQLIAGADVVVQNLAPGAVDRLGVGAKESLRVNPALVYSSISGYGTGGPYQDKKAYDLLIQCEAGLLSVTGTPEFPAKVGISIADIAAGMYAYSGILSALLKRSRTGTGQHIEVSMLEALGEWMGHPYFYAEYGGQPPARTGASHATIAPYGPFDCSDGVVFIAIQNDREWTRFCAEVVERPDLTEDVRYADNARRVQNRSELEATIRPVLRSLLRREVTDRLDSATIANATLRTMEDFSAHPQLEARGRWRQIDSPVGPLRSLVPPVNGDWEPRMDGVPALGADTSRVLAEFCKDQ
ncbi:CaiB/BaiF CoA transferase family protein [Rhodococcus wratislaviensis]|uniref:CaiB/BaiF family protein n=1 Tax=Rhodococcus wratislaviensis NBRC 100605 TaxID=1219028 RepID=X0Q392_RHOWR|nr:CaiB/BaiF CoA-transferase family protein [Rhodococcus wratislaviensis]GAF45507.1 CaiB/BaiF family protein [Rhodococcus wratislaviensis NBRC 100605]